ncbi:MAG: fatty acyl-AMP ligase [Deltaproteobacteria bacterium]|nr:fatty acyl-AMP ligase [Deltaproteobacteria bacterium]
MVETVVEALQNAISVENRGPVFLDQRLEPVDMSWAQIYRESEHRARCFRALGLEKGDRLGMIVSDQQEFVLSFLGALLAGAVPVPMYPPFTSGIDAYIERIAGILSSAEAYYLLAFKGIAPFMDRLRARVPTLKRLIIPNDFSVLSDQQLEAHAKPVSIVPDDTCLLQFTSGSTSHPKGVMVTHTNLISNIGSIYRRLGNNSAPDLLVNWLPLYHDFGLIGSFILSVIYHAQIVFIPTMAFALRPRIWMETVHRYRATITASTNFGLELAVKHTARIQQLDLSCLRVIVIGAEPINPDNARHFIETFSIAGLRSEALTPAYGMAEATLGITTGSPEQNLRTIRLDRQIYEEENRMVEVSESDPKNTLEVVSCGRTIPDHAVGIMDEQGTLLPEGQVGEVVFKGASTTAGYFGKTDATRRLFHEGWLKSGDLGSLLGGELYISGRLKDLIIIAGRNYHPHAIEWIVENVPGIRSASVAAFSIPGYGTERLVIVAECESCKNPQALKKKVKECVQHDMGLSPFDVVLIKPWSLPKTSSGKLKRRETRIAYESGTLDCL